MNLSPFRQSVRSAQRLRQIVSVFIKHGFGRVVEQLTLQKYIPLKKRLAAFGRWRPVRHLSDAERLRMAFAELGPTFIKLAQLLSSRPDLITEPYARELKRLQDEVPPFPAGEARRIVEEETGLPLGDVFRHFDERPLAAASIAQVHRATLLDGTPVAVKIQRPDIAEEIETDIRLLRVIARLMRRYLPESQFFNPEGIVEEFARTVRKELDFVQEGRNLERFRILFSSDPDVHIPRLFRELTGGRLLVMEFVEGVRIDHLGGIDALGIDRKELAHKGVAAYFRQIMEEGVFHADPHPGNILVEADGRLAFLDFGQVGRLSEELREQLADLFMALVEKDFDRAVDAYIEIGIVPEGADLDRFRREFRADLADLIEPMYGLTLAEVDVAAYLETLTELALRHRLQLPSDLLLVNKAFLFLENLGRRLDPDFDFMAEAEPYASRLIRSRLDPARLAGRARKNVAELGELAWMFPRQVRQLVQKMLRDNFHIHMHHAGLDRLIRDFDRSSNRIAFSLIVSALLLSSAIMHSTGVGPKVFGVSLLAVTAFIIAFLMGIWLLISIIRSGRL